MMYKQHSGYGEGSTLSTDCNYLQQQHYISSNLSKTLIQEQETQANWHKNTDPKKICEKSGLIWHKLWTS